MRRVSASFVITCRNPGEVEALSIKLQLQPTRIALSTGLRTRADQMAWAYDVASGASWEEIQPKVLSWFTRLKPALGGLERSAARLVVSVAETEPQGCGFLELPVAALRSVADAGIGLQVAVTVGLESKEVVTE